MDAELKLIDYARRIEGMTAEIISEIGEETNLRGSLTIRVPETVATVFIPEIVGRFHPQNPFAELSLINCSDSHLREELNSGRIELAFLITDSIDLKEVNVQMLRTENLVLVASPFHSLAGLGKVTYDDLHDHTLLLPKTD